MFIVLNFIFNIVTAKDKGIELFNDKKFAEAVDYYKTVLEARKDDPSAMFSLGSSSYYNNDIESALKSFENILNTSDKEEMIDFVTSFVYQNIDCNNIVVDEIFTSKKLIYTKDLLGRNKSNNHTGLILNIYSDGSVDKQYMIYNK